MENLTFRDADAEDVDTVYLGPVGPSSSDDTILRLANTNATFQAQDVTVIVSGADADQLWLSLDGDYFAASIDLGDIPPDSSSGPFWVRRVTPSTATGDCAATLTATPASWKYTLDTSTSDNVPLSTPDNPPDDEE